MQGLLRRLAREVRTGGGEAIGGAGVGVGAESVLGEHNAIKDRMLRFYRVQVVHEPGPRAVGLLRLPKALEGEPGVGYVLRPGFMLPPLMFSEDEIEALVLGSRWVADRGDDRLGSAARNALAKIAAVLPEDLRQDLDNSTLLIGPGAKVTPDSVDLAIVRKSIRSERKLAIGYRTPDGAATERTVWPFALGFFDRVRVMLAWCELRQDIRAFRTDRISRLSETGQRYPRRRQALLKAWREREGISGQA